MKRQAQAKKVKDIAEVAQKAGIPVLRQNDELKSLIQKSTDHNNTMKNTTDIVLGKV